MGNPVNAGGLIMPLILMRETDAKSPLNTETALIHYLEPKTQSSSPIYSLRAKKKWLPPCTYSYIGSEIEGRDIQALINVSGTQYCSSYAEWLGPIQKAHLGKD